MLFLKILSGTSPFMTTNTSATFLGIAKGEGCIYADLSIHDLTLSGELEVPAFSFLSLFSLCL